MEASIHFEVKVSKGIKNAEIPVAVSWTEGHNQTRFQKLFVSAAIRPRAEAVLVHYVGSCFRKLCTEQNR
jgi:hypothetical protein